MSPDLRELFSKLQTTVAGIDVSGAREGELQALLSEVRAAQRALDGLVVRIGVRSNSLAAVGQCAPACEVLRGDGDVGARQAGREAARAETADQLVGLADAVCSGRLAGEHLDSIGRHAKRLSEDQRDGFDFESLIERAEGLPPETFDHLVRRRVDAVVADHGLADTVAKQAASEFRHWFDEAAGMGRFTGSLDPERYEVLVTAVEQHSASIATASGGSVAKTANLAVRALVEPVIGNGAFNIRNRVPAITLVVDHDTVVHGAHLESVRQTEMGHDVPPETVARLCCDAVIRKVALDERGVPLKVGRKYRTATDAQWAAIKAGSRGCSWHGCSAPIKPFGYASLRKFRLRRNLEANGVSGDHGGPTDLVNLVPLCSSHHHRVHEGRWRIKLLPDRSLEIFKPDGTHHVTVPTPQRC